MALKQPRRWFALMANPYMCTFPWKDLQEEKRKSEGSRAGQAAIWARSRGWMESRLEKVYIGEISVFVWNFDDRLSVGPEAGFVIVPAGYKVDIFVVFFQLHQPVQDHSKVRPVQNGGKKEKSWPASGPNFLHHLFSILHHTSLPNFHRVSPMRTWILDCRASIPASVRPILIINNTQQKSRLVNNAKDLYQ